MDSAVTAALITGLITLVVGGPIAFFFGLQQRRRERFEERRDEVIARLSGLMYQVQDHYFHWGNPGFFPPGESEENIVQRHVEKATAAVQSQNELILYFFSNEAWLDPELAARVEDFIRTIKSITDAHPPDLKDIAFQLTPDGQRLSRRMRQEIAPLREDIIRDFKATLYPPPWYDVPLRLLERLRTSNRQSADS